MELIKTLKVLKVSLLLLKHVEMYIKDLDLKQLQVQVDISENDAVSLAETIRTLLADVEKINVHAVADRVVVMEHGRILQPGSARDQAPAPAPCEADRWPMAGHLCSAA